MAQMQNTKIPTTERAMAIDDEICSFLTLLSFCNTDGSAVVDRLLLVVTGISVFLVGGLVVGFNNFFSVEIKRYKDKSPINN